MGKTTPGVDRIMRQSAVAAATLGERALAAHVKICGTCSHAGPDLYARCGWWWKMATAVRKTRRQLAHWDADRNRNQAMLPGMEDL